MTTFQQRHDGRVAQAATCNLAHPRSIRGRVSNTTVAQMVERPAVNGEVVGSRPARGANLSMGGAAEWPASGLENRGVPDEGQGFDSFTTRQFLKHLGSSVVERGPEKSRVAGSIPALGAILNMVGSSMVEQGPPKPHVVGSIPTRHATFKGTLPELVKDLVANQRSASRGSAGSSPAGSAISCASTPSIGEDYWAVNPVATACGGSIPSAHTSLRLRLSRLPNGHRMETPAS